MYGVVKTSEQQLGRNEGGKERRTHGRRENARAGSSLAAGPWRGFKTACRRGAAGASQHAVPERQCFDRSSGSPHRLSTANGRGRGAKESRRCRCCRAPLLLCGPRFAVVASPIYTQAESSAAQRRQRRTLDHGHRAVCKGVLLTSPSRQHNAHFRPPELDCSRDASAQHERQGLPASAAPTSGSNDMRVPDLRRQPAQSRQPSEAYARHPGGDLTFSTALRCIAPDCCVAERSCHPSRSHLVSWQISSSYRCISAPIGTASACESATSAAMDQFCRL
ncbi:hypothetical protein BKA63DRAFT_583007 [Paraphoma chrysanthemicola]|nr:hypothetical protein BKA63DRAFT_583007 [Paraphoma chrysanthemicola]